MAGDRSWGAEEEDAKYHKQIKERKSSYSGFTAEGFETCNRKSRQVEFHQQKNERNREHLLLPTSHYSELCLCYISFTSYTTL